jgi:hypothetical protein
MPIKDVIFLGAGASAADGAPIQNALFRDYFQSRAYNDETNTVLSTFFLDFFGINTNSALPGANFPTVEEVLGILELALNRNESFRNYPSTPHAPKVQNTRESIIILIARILKDKLQTGRPIHDSLVSRLIRDSRLSETAFVSLNYDILIDNALTDIHAKFDLDYGIPFRNFSRKNDWHKPRANRVVKLFKLHGSLNWLYCPTCISLSITPKDKSKVSQYADTPIPCSSCQTNHCCLINL